MSRLRRTVAVLSSALLLQLTLLGGGAACEMRGAGTVEMAMMSHDMRGMADPSPAPTSCGAMDMSNGCAVPPTSGQCSSMSTCAVTAAPSFAVVARSAAPRMQAPDPDPAAFLSGPASAPELPPPRA